MSVASLPGLTLRESRYIALKTADPDISDREALRTAGFSESVLSHPDRVVSVKMRRHIEKLRTQAIEATLQEGVLDATEILRELIRQMGRLTAQAERLYGMLGHDIAELYGDQGALRPVKDWPEVWRRQLAAEVE